MLPSPDQNFKIWVRTVDFFASLVILIMHREIVESSNIYSKVSKWGKLESECSQWLHIYKCFDTAIEFRYLAMDSPKTDIFKKKRKVEFNLTKFFSHFTVGRERAT